MTREDFLLEEYRMLREEINDKLRAQDDILKTCLTFVTAIITLSLSNMNRYILLLIQPIILVCLLRYNSYRSDLARKLGYIVVCIEKNISIKWETYNALSYKKLKDLRITGALPHLLWVVMSIMGIVGEFIINYSKKEIAHWMLVQFHLVFLVLILFLICKGRFNIQRERSINDWAELNVKFQDKIQNNSDGIIDIITRHKRKDRRRIRTIKDFRCRLCRQLCPWDSVPCRRQKESVK